MMGAILKVSLDCVKEILRCSGFGFFLRCFERCTLYFYSGLRVGGLKQQKKTKSNRRKQKSAKTSQSPVPMNSQIMLNETAQNKPHAPKQLAMK